MHNKLKYLGYDIVFQEIPNEVTLAINISGCPHKCEGCHSKYLWQYTGAYISDDIDVLLDKYGKHVTCVCFMGGDQNQTELLYLLSTVRNRGIKTALYSGTDSIKDIMDKVINQLNYLKIGSYIEAKGGLDKASTNQVLFINNSGALTDITYKMKPR